MAEVGTKTGSKTQAGRDVYKTPEGEMVSEKSTTFKYKGKWINVPTIHNGYAYDDDILRMMLDAEVIEPTSTHKSKEDAIKSAVERSKSLNFNEGGDVASQTEEALGWAAEGKNLAVDIPEVSFRDAATFVAEMTPIIGDALAAKEVYDELQKDEPNYYLAGALGGAALVGLVPGIGDAAAKAIKKGAKEVFDVAKRVEVDPNAMGSGLGNVRLKPKQDDVTEADLPPAENAARTQIAGTLPTYKKADTLLTELSGEGKTLDFGAGLGLSKKELGFDTYEPFPKEDFKPDFNDPSEIPSNSYKKITNLNVLNVVPKDVRDTIVKDIGRILEPNGRAIITTRGRDVMAAKGKPGPEPMSIITSKDTYQKGFTQAELKEYLQETLGESFDVVNNKLGAAGVTVHKLPTTGYAEGGEVMKNQMEMAFMKQGGIKDDGMRRDPVSGNEIPPGSMAKEVRDDIPAMLSEGEYVVPADVLRFYGVNFFEDLRSKAKSGLQGMEQNGRIGGEPLSPQQIQQNMGQAPAPVQANQGGMMQGFNQAGLTAPSSTFDPSAFAVVGGSTFNNQGQQAQQDSVTTFKTFINSVDGSTQIVEFVDGNLKNPAMEKFTQPPYYEQGSSALKKAQAQSRNNNDDKPDFPEPAKGEDPKDWGLGVDWSDPMAYANSVIEGQMGRGTRSVLQGLSALAGPIGVAAVGAGLGIQALSQVSNLRAAAELARAQGMDEQAKSIDSMVSKFMAEQPAIVDFFDDLRGESNKNALTVMDRMGLQYSRDPKTGRITYTPQQVKFNEIAAKRAGMDNKAKADSILKDMQNSSGDDDDGGLFPVTAVSIDTDAGGHTTQSMTYGSGDDAVVATADEDGYNKGGLMAPKKKKK